MLFITNKHDATTCGIANKGVSSVQNLAFRLHPCVGGYERGPQSLTSHTAETLHVMSAAEKSIYCFYY
jgi:hypothetical protein